MWDKEMDRKMILDRLAELLYEAISHLPREEREKRIQALEKRAAEEKFADLMEEHLSKFSEADQDRLVKAGTKVVISRQEENS
jgi:hypothetical protein